MTINDIINKCIEIPGVSIKRSISSTELILNVKEGKGSMTFFSLFPGLTIAYIFVDSPSWTIPDLYNGSSNEKGYLLLNYCIAGRCEMNLNNETFVYVKDGEISLTEHFALKQYVYPRRIYEGIEFFIDKSTLSTQSTWIINEFNIDFMQLTDIYCPSGNTYISTVTPEVNKTLIKLWTIFELHTPFAISQMKIYSLALFSLLLNFEEIPQSQACTFFTKTQVDIAKRVENIITDDLRQHHPAWELAEIFSISETSIKNYFRGVFGQNISIYLREIRMKRAAELLTNTKYSVAQIAEQVGYINQSKFAAAFKRYYNLTPLEYKRKQHIDQKF